MNQKKGVYYPDGERGKGGEGRFPENAGIFPPPAPPLRTTARRGAERNLETRSDMEEKSVSTGHMARKAAGMFVKLAIAGGIVAYLFFSQKQQILSSLKDFDYGYLAAASAVYCFHAVVCSWRWRELCRMLDFQLSGFEAFSLTMQAYFFSLLIPGGAIGGDLVKAGVLSARTPKGEKLEGAFTILMDRIIGMIALFSLILVLLPFATPLMMNVELDSIKLDRTLKIWGIAGLYLLCVVGLVASGVVFFHRAIEKVPPFGRLMNWGDRITGGMVRRVCDASDVYRRQWRKLAVLTVITSIFVHIDIVAAFYILLCGINGFEGGVFVVLVAGIVGSLIGLIPLFPGGIGGRDVATIMLLCAGGVSAGVANGGQLIFTAVLVVFSVLGGVFFVLDPGRKKVAAKTGNAGGEKAA